jgi:hypothetical protein
VPRSPSRGQRGPHEPVRREWEQGLKVSFDERKGREKTATHLRELALLHTLTDEPVNEGALRVEQVELAVKAGPGGGDGGGVGEHAERAGDLGKVTSGDVRGGLVADTELETGRAPVDELDGTLGLDGSNGRVDVLGDDVTAVEEGASHVLALARVALDHLVVGLEARVGELGNRVGLVGRLGRRDDRGVGREREVDTGEGNLRGRECQ